MSKWHYQQQNVLQWKCCDFAKARKIETIGWEEFYAYTTQHGFNIFYEKLINIEKGNWHMIIIQLKHDFFAGNPGWLFSSPCSGYYLKKSLGTVLHVLGSILIL